MSFKMTTLDYSICDALQGEDLSVQQISTRLDVLHKVIQDRVRMLLHAGVVDFAPRTSPRASFKYRNARTKVAT